MRRLSTMFPVGRLTHKVPAKVLYELIEPANTMLSRHCAIYVRNIGQAEVMLDRRQQAQAHPGLYVKMRPEQIASRLFLSCIIAELFGRHA